MERVSIFDLNGVQVHDPEGSIGRATEITFNSAWPKGFMEASFKVKRADVFADWIVKESFGVIITDGATIVYQGRIETMPRTVGGLDEYVTVQCVGWYCVLEERTIRKRWIDIKGISFLRWPDGLGTSTHQTSWVTNKRDNIIQVFVGTGDITRQRGTAYRELYELPSGHVRRISFDYIIRSNENFSLSVYNVDNPSGYIPGYPADYLGTEWYTISADAPQAGSATIDFQLGNTRTFEIRWTIEVTDIYDQNDFGHPSNLRVEATYETGHRTSTPTYTQGQLVEDVILLVNQKGAQLSTDFSQLGDPGLILDPFGIEEPTYAGPVIEQIASYGDALLQTWGLSVWDQSDTSDAKPRVVFEARSVADYEYVAELSAGELSALTYEKVSDDLYNSVDVQYINNRKETRYRSSADNAALADAASIAAEYRRDYPLKIGDGDATRADYVGRRFIQYHKDRLTRATIAIQGVVTTKEGGQVPASRVRAGQRIKILNTDEILFIRHTSYDAETQTVRISPDLPVDNIAMLFVQRERGMGQLAK